MGLAYGVRTERSEVPPFKEMSEKEKFIFLFPNGTERKTFATQKFSPYLPDLCDKCRISLKIKNKPQSKHAKIFPSGGGKD